MKVQLETPRLILRSWKNDDIDSFVLMSQDKDVMQYFKDVLNRKASIKFINQIQYLIDLQGWGFWAVESKITGEFLGFTGLHQQPEKFEFSPCTEIGWRFKRSAWGNGYASEAAVASFKYGFDILKLNEIVAFTACEIIYLNL